MAGSFGIARGVLQGLQKDAGVFCGMVVCFCRHLQWHELANVLFSFQVGDGRCYQEEFIGGGRWTLKQGIHACVRKSVRAWKAFIECQLLYPMPAVDTDSWDRCNFSSPVLLHDAALMPRCFHAFVLPCFGQLPAVCLC